MNQCFTYSISSSFSFFAEIFTFSAKEKDSETGFSYFGSRYYSSDLSIWLSVDPMSDKYPSLSPYTYCANNPIKLVDPNGEEIVISQTTNEKGNKVINISFSAKIVNKSSTAINGEKLQSYSNRISEAIQSYYSGTKEDGTIVNVDVNIKTSSFDENGNIIDNISDYTINIVDDFENALHVGEAEIGGSYMSIRKDILENPNSKEYSSLERTAGHEFGHLLGLEHSLDSFNLMSQGEPGTNVTTEQIKEATQNYSAGKLNNGIFRFPHQKR